MKVQDEKIKDLEGKTIGANNNRRSSNENEEHTCIRAMVAKCVNERMVQIEEKMNEERRKPKTNLPRCFTCGKIGHISRNCWHRGRVYTNYGRQEQWGHQWNNRRWQNRRYQDAGHYGRWNQPYEPGRQSHAYNQYNEQRHNTHRPRNVQPYYQPMTTTTGTQPHF